MRGRALYLASAHAQWNTSEKYDFLIVTLINASFYLDDFYWSSIVYIDNEAQNKLIKNEVVF